MEYVKGIESQIAEGRRDLEKIPAIPTSNLVAGIVIAITMIVTIISSLLRPKRVRYATTPPTIYDLFGSTVSNTFTFVVFPGFIIFNVLINQWYMQGMRMYDGKVLTIGYLLHTSTGSLYLIAGGLQFYTPLRQHYPKIHRMIGYLYYVMVVLTTIGIIIISIKPHSGLSTQIAVATFLPPWMAINFYALRAIVIFRDVELHR